MKPATNKRRAAFSESLSNQQDRILLLNENPLFKELYANMVVNI